MRMDRWSSRVKNWKQWLLLSGFWLGALSPGQGQSINIPTAEDRVEQPPPTGVADHIGLSQRNPALLAKLGSSVRQLRDEHGFRIYVVLESVLVTGNAQSMATRLQRNWIPKGDGMVLVFEMDTRALGIGQGFEQGVDPEKATPAQVPSYETMAILTKAGAGLNRASAETMLESFVTTVVDGYNDYFRRKSTPVPEGRSVRFGLIIVGGASALALIGLLAALMVRRSDRRGGGKCFVFPETEAPERLGAPYGGGEVSSRRFGRGAAESS
jgi:hypothetical protein